MTKPNEQVERLLKERYYTEGENWSGLCRRVAKTFSGGDEKLEEEIYNIMFYRKAIFASPSLMNSGTRFGMLSSCFVFAMEDSIESIWESARDTALTFKKGGGVGYDISVLRPKGARINTTGGTSSGPLSLGMGILDQTAESVKQGGLRKGALMVVMRVDHPDIEEFISAKMEEGKFPNCNISVTIPDSFMMAVADDADWDLVYDGEVYKTIRAKDLFNKIAYYAWNNGEPGVIFIDTVNKYNFVPHLGDIQTSNPCVTGDTLIKTIAGDKPIKDFVGKEISIVSYNEETKLFEVKRGYNVQKTKENAKVLKIKTKTGEEIRLTEDHKVYTQRGWIEAGKLKKSDKILRLKMAELSEAHEFVEIESIEEDGYEDVYDMTVEDNHNFVANGLVVHNCGEYFAIPFGSCNLASINLASLINKEDDFDWEEYERIITVMTRALDNGIDVNKFPIDKVDEVTKNIRPLGLGVMGLADVLIAKRLKYSSEAGRKLSRSILQTLSFVSMQESILLSKEKGPFPAIEGSLWEPKLLPKNNYLNQVSNVDGRITVAQWGKLIQDISLYGIRNCHTTVIAPTGSISQIAGDFAISGGIEPFYKMQHNRMVVVDSGERWENVLAAPAQKWIKEHEPNETEKGKFSLPNYFEDGESISWKDHIKMQAELQKVVHNGISKTINMPNSATIEEVKKAYQIAWGLGCKGLTIYRDGSRQKQVLSTKLKEDSEAKEPTERKLTPWGVPVPVKISLNSTEMAERHILQDPEIQLQNGKTKLYVYVTLYDDVYPIEIVTKFDAETKDKYVEEMKYRSLISRFISVMLRYGIPLEEIIKHLRRTSGNFMDFSGQLAKILTSYLNEYVEDQEIPMSEGIKEILKPKCENCGQELVYQESCFKCLNPNCGFSRC